MAAQLNDSLAFPDRTVHAHRFDRSPVGQLPPTRAALPRRSRADIRIPYGYRRRASGFRKDPAEPARWVPACDAGADRRLFVSTAREDDMTDTAYVVLILMGFSVCALVLRALYVRGER